MTSELGEAVTCLPWLENFLNQTPPLGAGSDRLRTQLRFAWVGIPISFEMQATRYRRRPWSSREQVGERQVGE